MSTKCDVFPLFSSPVCSMIIGENIDEYFWRLKNVKFRDIDTFFSNGVYSSENVEVLDICPELHNIILKYFNLFKNDVLHYENTEFKITTSWMTRCTRNSYSQLHIHNNSLFSAVLYFEDHDPQSTITFEELSVKNNIDIVPTVDNIFNARDWTIKTQKNQILFFPSYVYHRIGMHLSDKIRYSLAVNFYPVGCIGGFDSTINIDVKPLTY